MELTLYQNISEQNKLDKTLNNPLKLTGTVRGVDNVNIISPIISISNIDEQITNYNYAYIKEFNRYYFINNIRSLRNDLWLLELDIDVLTTYKDQIRAQKGLISRNENEFNNALIDDRLTMEQDDNTYIQFSTIECPFNREMTSGGVSDISHGFNFVLVYVGGKQDV